MPVQPLIVYFPPWSYWERENRSQPLARALAQRGHQVLYVNYPLGKRLGSRLKSLARRRPLQTVQPGLHLTLGGPLLGPTYHWRDMLYLAPEGPTPGQRAFGRFLVKSLGQEPFRGREIVILSSRMISRELARRVRPSRYVIDMEDPWSHFAELWQIPQAALWTALGSFTNQADLVLANGRKIAEAAQEAFLARTPQILLNGVDPGNFSPDPSLPRPSDYPPGPSVLYSGTVHERLDFDLLEPVFQALPRVNFIFLGVVFSHLAAKIRQVCSRHGNVHFLGHHHLEELAAYLQQADLFMMPFKRDEAWTRAFPAKLFEYFLFGRPTISSFALQDIPPQFQSAIRVAPDSAGFMSLVEEGLRDTRRDPALAAYGRRQTWQARAEQVAGALGL